MVLLLPWCGSKRESIFRILVVANKGEALGDELISFVEVSFSNSIPPVEILSSPVEEEEDQGTDGNPAYNFKANFQSRHFLVEAGNILFESYRAVLHALKTKDAFSLPFQKYLCPSTRPDAQLIVDRPIYAFAPRFRFDLSFLVNDEPLHLRVDDPRSVENCRGTLSEKSSLDRSQVNALLGALTSEFACILGPPGTGKTYLALQVVRTILKSNIPGSILVVCYTNHALDQFLALLLDTGFTNITRVGSKCTNEKVEKYRYQPERLVFSSNIVQLKDRLNKRVDEYLAHMSALKDDVSMAEKRFFLQKNFPHLHASLESIRDGDFELAGSRGKATNAYNFWVRGNEFVLESAMPIEM